MRELNIDRLKKGVPGITSTAGSYFAEAAIFALIKKGHKPGALLKVEGKWKGEFNLIWLEEPSKELTATWDDEQELAEFAATGIAILLALELTNYTEFKRARKGDRMDYWLGRKDKNGLSLLEALLEISGMLTETKDNRLAARVKQKKEQLKKSPYKTCLDMWR